MGKPREKFDLAQPIYKLREFKKFPDENEIHFWEPGVELFSQAPGVDLDAFIEQKKLPIFSKLAEHEKDRVISDVCKLPQAQGFGIFVLIKSNHLAEIYLVPAYNENDNKTRINFKLVLPDKKIEHFSVESGPWEENRAGITHTSMVDLCYQHGITSINSKHITNGCFIGFGLIKTTKGFIFLNRSANMQIPSVAWDPFYAEVQGGFLNSGRSNPLRYAPREISLVVSRVIATALKIPSENVIHPNKNYNIELEFCRMSTEAKISLLKHNFIRCMIERNSMYQIDVIHMNHINKIAKDNHIRFLWMRDDWNDIYEGLFSEKHSKSLNNLSNEYNKKLTANYSEVLQQLIIAGLNDETFIMLAFDDTHPIEEVRLLKNSLLTLQEKFNETSMLSEATLQAELKQLKSGTPIQQLEKLVYVIGSTIKTANPKLLYKLIHLLTPLAKPLNVNNKISEYVCVQSSFLLELKTYLKSPKSNSKKIISLIESTTVDLNVSSEPLLIIAVKHNDKELINFLLKQKIYINEKYFGTTALTAAAKIGNVDTVMKLLEHGADINYALEEASSANHYKIIKILLDHDSLPSKHPDKVHRITTAALNAISEDSVDCLKLLLETKEIDFSKIKHYGFDTEIRHLLIPHIIFLYPYPSIGETLSEAKLPIENRFLIDDIHMLSERFKISLVMDNERMNVNDFKQQVVKLIDSSFVSPEDKLKYKTEISKICNKLKIKTRHVAINLFDSTINGRKVANLRCIDSEVSYLHNLYSIYPDPVEDAKNRIRELNKKLPIGLQFTSDQLTKVFQKLTTHHALEQTIKSIQALVDKHQRANSPQLRG